VHQAGDESLQQLALGEHVGDLGFDARRHAVEALRGLSGANQLEQKNRTPRKQRDRDDDCQNQRA
jgi:hypothetical protein